MFDRVTDKSGLILFDLKHHHRERHRQFTGVYNDSILANLKSLVKSGRPVLVRLPVITGCNDTLADAASYTAPLASAGVKEVQLLPFHQFGKHKCRLLGRDYALKDARPLCGEDLAEFAQALRSRGIQALPL